MDKIEIKGYKSIKDMELPLRSVNILIGANGSGKTNFLSFFEFLKNIYVQNLRGFVAERGAEKLLHKGPKVTETISAKLSFGKNKYSFAIKSSEAGFVFTEEGLWYSGNPYVSNPIDISTMSYESNLRNSTVARAKYIRDYLGGLVKYHFHDTSTNSPFTQTCNIETDKYLLYSKGQNLAAFLYNIRETAPVSYNLIVHTVQSIAPYFGDFFLQPAANGNVKLLWTSKYSETVYGPTDLSDGTIRFIALATLFLQPTLPPTIH
jgi:predicted ATPase